MTPNKITSATLCNEGGRQSENIEIIFHHLALFVGQVERGVIALSLPNATTEHMIPA